MSAYYPLVLERSYAQKEAAWGGLFYVIPLLLMTLAGPLWGQFADRFGKRLSLLRAQLGLSLALYCCSLAPTPAWFALGLALQGIFGGTFSASNALLSEYYRGPALARSLSYLQYSARLGLFLAPSLLGPFVMKLTQPQDVYAWLWLLPLASLTLLQFGLPQPQTRPQSELESLRPSETTSLPFHLLVLAEFGFTLITVLTFPYFAKFFVAAPTGLGPEWSGLFFGIPHVVYLLLAFLVIGKAQVSAAPGYVSLAFFLYCASMLWHLMAVGPFSLVAARILMGLSLVFGYVYLNLLFSAAIRPTSAGRAFGWLDSASKFAGVLAGLLASLSVQVGGLAAPFAVAAVLGLLLWLASLRYRKVNVA